MLRVAGTTRVRASCHTVADMTATGSDRWPAADGAAGPEPSHWDAWILPEHLPGNGRHAVTSRPVTEPETDQFPQLAVPQLPVDPDDEPTQALYRLDTPLGYGPPAGVEPGPARHPDQQLASPTTLLGAPGGRTVAGRPRPPTPPPVTPTEPPPTERDSVLLLHPPRSVVRKRARRRRMLEWPALVVVSLLAALVLRTFVVQTFFIPSQSMHDTLLEGDRVLVNKLAYHLHGINRGDVIVFGRPPNISIPDNDLIKRVIGLPGDQIEARDGKVYIDGRLLAEPYVQKGCTDGTVNLPRTVVPTGHVFVMGDNRCDSTDSRVFGPIGESLVVGRAFVLIWPLGRAGWL
jgi:signal peptidase I